MSPEGATEILRFHWLLSPLPGLLRNVAPVRGLSPPAIVCRRSAAIQRSTVAPERVRQSFETVSPAGASILPMVLVHRCPGGPPGPTACPGYR
jgi:hypothetical protein